GAALGFELPPTPFAGAPATSRGSPAGSIAPTCSPDGRELLRALKTPLPFPRPPADLAFVSDLVPTKSGVPEAFGFPFGFAANSPRRLPPGTGTGPVGATG